VGQQTGLNQARFSHSGATAKCSPTIEGLFEHSALLLSGKDLRLAVGRSFAADVDQTPVANTGDIVERLQVLPAQSEPAA